MARFVVAAVLALVTACSSSAVLDAGSDDAAAADVPSVAATRPTDAGVDFGVDLGSDLGGVDLGTVGAWRSPSGQPDRCTLALADDPAALGPVTFTACSAVAGACREATFSTVLGQEIRDATHGYVMVEEPVAPHAWKQFLVRDDGAIVFAAAGPNAFDAAPAPDNPCAFASFADATHYVVYLFAPSRTSSYSGNVAMPFDSWAPAGGAWDGLQPTYLSDTGALFSSSSWATWGTAASPVGVRGSATQLFGDDLFTTLFSTDPLHPSARIYVAHLPAFGVELFPTAGPNTVRAELATDGVDMAWWSGDDTTTAVELHTSPYATDPALVFDATVDTAPGTTTAIQLYVGGGHAAAAVSSQRIAVWELATGTRHDLILPTAASVGGVLYAGPSELAFVVTGVTLRTAVDIVPYSALP